MSHRLKQALDMATPQACYSARYVYIIGGDGGTTKVGIATKPLRRLRDIKTSSGRFELRVVAERECGESARMVERRVHVVLEGHRAGGEWFNVSPEEAISALDYVLATPVDVGMPAQDASKRQLH